MIKSKFMAVGTMLLLLGQAHGATEVEVVNERMEEGKKQAYTVKALFQGLKSRYTFHSDEEDAETDSGTYLLSLDGGVTAYYIDASDNSCNQWSNEKLVQTLSGFLLKTTDKYNVNTADVEVHKVFEKDVADMHDLPVKHIRINISFTASYKYMFFKDKYKIERIADFWVTPEIEGIDEEPIFQTIDDYTSNHKFDQEMRGIAGADAKHRLRSEINQTMTDKKGKESSLQLLQYVDSIILVDDLPDAEFELPDCNQVDADKMEKKFKKFLKQLLG